MDGGHPSSDDDATPLERRTRATDRRPNRRQVLTTLGASALAGAVAGCTGGEDPGGAGTDDPNADDTGDSPGEGGECTPGHSSGDSVCQQIADDAGVLTAFDATGTALPVTFEYPCGWTTSTTDQFDDRAQANASRSRIADGGSVDVQVRAYYRPVSEGFLDSQEEDGSYEEIEVTYDGATRRGLVSDASTAQFGTLGHAVVPVQDALVHVELVSTLHAESCDIDPRPDYELVGDMLRSIEPNADTTFSPAAPAGDAETSVDGLAAVDHAGEPREDRYAVTLTVENTGDRETDIDEYDIDQSVFDASGTDITGAGTLIYGQDGTVAPGETVEMRIESQVEDGNSPDDVARYQVTLFCGTFSDGVYCEG